MFTFGRRASYFRRYLTVLLFVHGGGGGGRNGYYKSCSNWPRDDDDNENDFRSPRSWQPSESDGGERGVPHHRRRRILLAPANARCGNSRNRIYTRFLQIVLSLPLAPARCTWRIYIKIFSYHSSYVCIYIINNNIIHRHRCRRRCRRRLWKLYRSGKISVGKTSLHLALVFEWVFYNTRTSLYLFFSHPLPTHPADDIPELYIYIFVSPRPLADCSAAAEQVFPVLFGIRAACQLKSGPKRVVHQ